MVPIRGRAMLDIWLEICEQAGIDEVLINLHAHSEPVRAALRQWKRRVRVHLSEEPVLLGSAGTLVCNRDWVAAEPQFWVLYADVLTNANLNEMLQFHIKSARAGIRGKTCPPAK